MANIDETTIDYGLGIKPETNPLDLSDISKAALITMLSDAKFLIIDELSMLLSGLRTDIDSKLREEFKGIKEKKFAVLAAMTAADLFQVSPVKGKVIFSKFCDKDSLKHLLRLQLKHLYNYAVLTAVVILAAAAKQRDKPFIDLLNKVWVGNIDDDVKNYLR